MQAASYRAYFRQVPVKIFLSEGRKKEDDLGFDYSMDIRSRRVIHVGRPGRCHRAPRYAPRSGRRFGESLGRRKTETTRNTKRRRRAVRQTSAELDLPQTLNSDWNFMVSEVNHLYSTDSIV